MWHVLPGKISLGSPGLLFPAVPALQQLCNESPASRIWVESLHDLAQLEASPDNDIA